MLVTQSYRRPWRRKTNADDHALGHPKGNGYQATVTFPDGVSFSSAETYPSIAQAMTAAALKLLDMPERLEALDRLETPVAP
jgi:hypothetical protein